MTTTTAPATAPDAPAEQLLGRGSGVALLVWSLLGLAAALTLAAERVQMLIDPTFEPSCNFNPVLSCGSVMVTDQASVLGFPNPFLGIAGFTAIAVVGALIASRVVVPTWILAGATLGSLAGLGFVGWLAFQSLYRIGALCPWCLVVWAVTIPIAIWLTLALLERTGTAPGAVAAAWMWRFSLVAALYLLVVVLALVRFWDYWSTLV